MEEPFKGVSGSLPQSISICERLPTNPKLILPYEKEVTNLFGT